VQTVAAIADCLACASTHTFYDGAGDCLEPALQRLEAADSEQPPLLGWLSYRPGPGTPSMREAAVTRSLSRARPGASLLLLLTTPLGGDDEPPSASPACAAHDDGWETLGPAEASGHSHHGATEGARGGAPPAAAQDVSFTCFVAMGDGTPLARLPLRIANLGRNLGSGAYGGPLAPGGGVSASAAAAAALLPLAAGAGAQVRGLEALCATLLGELSTLAAGAAAADAEAAGEADAHARALAALAAREGLS
jgi:hypothetical protein